MKKLTNAHQASVYYDKDDYYMQSRLVAPSSWWGEGARRLRLSGEVDRDAFRELLEGRLPNGIILDKGSDGTHSPGVDLTFSAPKSVSLLGLIHGDERVLRAHEHAVTIALKHLQRTTPRVRVRSDGLLRVEATNNLIVARFSHESSRALDPQLHTHCVVMNATKRSDGQWKALANQEIYRAHRAIGAVYRAELAGRLRQLGYGIERTHADGRFEVAGFSKETLDAFSQRRAQIEAHLEARRLDGARAARVAAVATRDAKRDVDRDVLREDWGNRARSLGVDFEQARARSRAMDRGSRRARADEVLDRAVEHLTERKVVAAEQRIIQHALGLGVGDVRLEDVQRALARKVEEGALVPAVSSRQKDPHARHYTTDAALLVERDLLHILERGRGRESALIGAADLGRAIEEVDRLGAHRLTAGQSEAIRLALSTNDRIVGIQGYAGTGKTSGALLHIRRLAEQEGLEVRGFAPSAAAAEILERDAGMPSMTLARFLKSRESKYTVRQLWIVDESSMMSNHTARAFLDRARRARARVVFVGDRDQLPAIQAGGPFGLLIDHGMPVATIETIVRQKNPEILKAVVKTIQRDHDGALRQVAPHVIQRPALSMRLGCMVAAYLSVPEAERDSVLIITPRNDERQRLNEQIRERLKGRSQLGKHEIDAEILVAKDLTRAAARDPLSYEGGDIIRFTNGCGRLDIPRGTLWSVAGRVGGVLTLQGDSRIVRWNPNDGPSVEVYRREWRELAVGDMIRWTRNDRKQRRVNGEVGRVVSVDLEANVAEVRFRKGIRTLRLDAAGHWEHAYATTVHAAQGRTADRVLLHLEVDQAKMLGHEGWYVGLSRARKEIKIYTDDRKRLAKEIGISIQQESAIAVERDRVRKRPAERSKEKEERTYFYGFGRGF